MRTYRGREIWPIASCDARRAGFKWYVQDYHGPTGMPYCEDLCPAFHSLAAAREAIRESDEGRMS